MTAHRVGADNEPIGCLPGAATLRCEATAEVSKLLASSAEEVADMEACIYELVDSLSD